MLEQAVCTEQLFPPESLRGVQKNVPLPGPHSATSRAVALICHDLRLPLTAILANAEFLTRSDISAAERNEYYQEIRCSIERMNQLVTSLSESSTERDTFRPGVRNIVDTIERAIRMTRAKKEFRRITIEHHHRGPARGWFDSSRLERVVSNLILNACEAVSPDMGLVVITTMGSHADLQIGVWDNGPGIHTEIQDFIFQPFVSYGKAEGRGLGLAIVKEIVEDHGGEVYLDRSGGAGTLFRITIPFAIPLVAIPRILAGTIRSARTEESSSRSVHTP
jgi:signal transduction histidine kinase